MRKNALHCMKLFPGFLAIVFCLLTSVVVSAQEKKKAEVRQENKNTPLFVVVQIPAQFPGGKPAWQKFLAKTVSNKVPVDKGAPPGTYTVTVSFIVDENGSLSDVRAVNDPGYGTKAEAERVLKAGPKWLPAYQNGKKVKYRHKESIRFEI